MKNILGIALVVIITTGCASGLNSIQKKEYQALKSDNVLIEEKSPAAGAALGILPGGGSFYAGEPVLGVVNLLSWPLSIFWDPISGYSGAMAANYNITKQELSRKKRLEINELENKLTLKKISNEEYVVEKRSIEQKYNYR